MNIRLHIVYTGLILLLTATTAWAQKSKPLTFTQLEKQMAVKPKPVVVTIYTNWCVYCKLQKAQLNKSNVQQLLNNDFYWVNFNAEEKNDISFDGDTYSFLPAYKVNRLAGELGAQNGQLSYPTLVVLDKNYHIKYRLPGVVKAKNLYQLLTYYK